MSEPLHDLWGTYVHVPWCRRRCPYCAFYVEADRQVPWETFVDRLLQEHARRKPAFPGQSATAFLGGGTPSRMPTAPLARLLDGLALAPDAEITAETNPEDATEAWLQGALQAGVNRLSVGIQTFDTRFARLLNRMSTVDQARTTARRVAAAGFRSWSVDVMFGLPGQSLQDLAVDLDAILEVRPPHVSLYGLTIEPGTPFERARDAGRLVPADDELAADMYDLLVERLGQAGLQRYEVSNFARPGHESVHNRLYWSDRPYLGLGPSAHGYAPDGTRWVNRSDAAEYLDGAEPTEVTEPPDPEQRALDLLVSCLRGREGLSRAHLRARSGHDVSDATVAELSEAGLLRVDGDRLALTSRGFPLADAVVRRLADSLAKAPPAN